MNRGIVGALLLAGSLSWTWTGCSHVATGARLGGGSCTGPETEARELEVYGAVLASINDKHAVELMTETGGPNTGLVSLLGAGRRTPERQPFPREASAAVLDYQQRNRQHACLRQVPVNKLETEAESGALTVALSRVGFDAQGRYAVVSFEANVAGAARSSRRGVVALVKTDVGWLVFNRLSPGRRTVTPTVAAHGTAIRSAQR
jgi:hypothetical protein